MAATTKFDISSENLDLYFEQQLASISPQAKEAMPKDVAFKIYRGGAKSNTKSTSKLGFIARLWIMWKFLHKRIWVVVEDTEKGLDIKDFFDLRDAIDRKEKNFNPFEKAEASMTFITANKELSDCFAVLNNACSSPAYNYIQKAKNGIKLQKKNKVDEWKMQMKYIVRFITFWEGHKKKWIAENVVSVPEFYVLIALYDEVPVQSSSIYKGIFKYAFQSSMTKVQKAFTTLQHRKMIDKIGESKHTKFKITPLGTEVVNGILTKYALKF